MGKVAYDEGSGVEGFVCAETDAVAADARGPVQTARCVDAEVELVVLGSEEAGGESLVFGEVADVFAVCSALWVLLVGMD